LQVKKVDFAGKKWECIFGKKIKVNIKDEDFLSSVARNLPITKSTKLKCTLEIVNQLDKKGEIQGKGVVYNILKAEVIVEVIVENVMGKFDFQ
jgi:hypothetical protein